MATVSLTTIPTAETSQLPQSDDELRQPRLNDMGVDLMMMNQIGFDEPSPTSRSAIDRCEFNLNCNMRRHRARASVEDGNANLPKSRSTCDAPPAWMTVGCNGNPADVESLRFDGLRRRSSNWIVNNLTSTVVCNADGANTEAAGTCSGVVWVETVEPHLGLLVNSSGHSDRPTANLNRTLDECGTVQKRLSNRPRTYEAVNSHNHHHHHHHHRPAMAVATVQSSRSLDGSVLSFLRCSSTKGTNDAKHAAVLEEPIHMTLEEVRFSLNGVEPHERPPSHQCTSTGGDCNGRKQDKGSRCRRNNKVPPCTSAMDLVVAHHKKLPTDVRCLLPKSLKHTLCHWLGLGKGIVAPVASGDSSSASSTDDCSTVVQRADETDHGAPGFVNRALPPLPLARHRLNDDSSTDEDNEYSDTEDRVASVLPWWNRISAKSTTDFASSIQKVKDYGWYWGPISGQAAEAILADEPDGSFVVRDSSDEHYIFSLTFKLDGLVRHVRIEHDHGNFSFGTFTKFKSNTIVEFVENAVQHSRSGRYLFFLHRRPILGPMRVQLLHPVSRFKQVQSLQHICRFVILKVVRRDLIDCLPLPNRLKGYLNTLQYYSEEAVVVERDDVEIRDETGGSEISHNPVTHF